MGMVPNGRNHSLRATRRPIAESTGRRPLFTLAIDRDIARFLGDQMVPVIGKLSKAASSDGVEIGLYSRDRTLSLLRQVRGLAQLLLPRLAFFSESPKDSSAYRRPARYDICRSRRKGNNGQNEAAAIIVFNNSNQK
jgi:hypothetical protein